MMKFGYPSKLEISFRRNLILFIGIMGVALLVIGCAATNPVPMGKNASGQNSALIKASRNGDRERVVTLIRQGADINAKDAEGWTPYLAASVAGKWEIMALLQGMGCKTDPGF